MEGVPGYTVTELNAFFILLLIAASAAVCKVVVKILKVSSRLIPELSECVFTGASWSQRSTWFSRPTSSSGQGLRFFFFLILSV